MEQGRGAVGTPWLCGVWGWQGDSWLLGDVQVQCWQRAVPGGHMQGTFCFHWEDAAVRWHFLQAGVGSQGGCRRLGGRGALQAGAGAAQALTVAAWPRVALEGGDAARSPAGTVLTPQQWAVWCRAGLQHPVALGGTRRQRGHSGGSRSITCILCLERLLEGWGETERCEDSTGARWHCNFRGSPRAPGAKGPSVSPAQMGNQIGAAGPSALFPSTYLWVGAVAPGSPHRTVPALFPCKGSGPT